MKTIYKYEFDINDEFTLKLPHDHAVLKVDVQNSTPCMWILIEDTKAPTQDVKFLCRGTGHEIKTCSPEFIGTFFHGPFVWHIFKDI